MSKNIGPNGEAGLAAVRSVFTRALNKDELVAGAIAGTILNDITDRKGLRQAWDSIDEEVQKEILELWIEEIKTIL